MAIARAIMHEPAEIHAHTEYISQYFCCMWCSEAPLHCATQSSPIRCFPGNLRFPEKARRSPGSDCGRAIQVVLVLLHRHHIRVCPKPVADTRSHEPETCTVYERRDSLRIKRETLRPRIILTFLLLVIATACLERAQGAFVEEAPVEGSSRE